MVYQEKWYYMYSPILEIKYRNIVTEWYYDIDSKLIMSALYIKYCKFTQTYFPPQDMWNYSWLEVGVSPNEILIYHRILFPKGN